MSARGSVVTLGVDLGTSSVKVLAVRSDGRVVAQAKRSYPTSSARFRAEQDLRDLERATAEALAASLADLGDADRVAAIGFSCAMHGVVPVDGAGEPLGPLVTWLDRRGLSVAARWREDGTAAALYQRTGAPVHPMLPACKIRASLDANDEAYVRAARFVSAKEAIVARLTGEWLVDYGIASGTGLYEPLARRWSEAALEAAGIRATSLSEIAATSRSLPATGPLARELGLGAQTRIVLGSSDGALANDGTGSGAPGTIAASLGSSGAVRVVSDDFAVDQQSRTFCYACDDTRYLIGGATGSGGTALAAAFGWLLPEIAPELRFARACELAERSPIGARGVVVRPDLAGARAPSWDAGRSGSFEGLALDTTRDDLLRGLLEGVIGDLAEVHALVRERAVGGAIRVAGGNFTSAFVRQMFADMCDRTVEATEPTEASALGAATCAARAIGAVASDAEAAGFVRRVQATTPSPAAVRAYAALSDRRRLDRSMGGVLDVE